MDRGDQVWLRRLMAKATAMLEDAVETALAGQSKRLSAARYARAARRIHAAAQDIAVITEAATIVANLGVNQPGTGGNRAAKRTGLPSQSKHCLVRHEG